MVLVLDFDLVRLKEKELLAFPCLLTGVTKTIFLINDSLVPFGGLSIKVKVLLWPRYIEHLPFTKGAFFVNPLRGVPFAIVPMEAFALSMLQFMNLFLYLGNIVLVDAVLFNFAVAKLRTGSSLRHSGSTTQSAKRMTPMMPKMTMAAIKPLLLVAVLEMILEGDKLEKVCNEN